MVSTLSSLPYSVSGAVLTSNPARKTQNPAYAQKPHQALDSFTFTGKRKIEDISHDPDEMDRDSGSDEEDFGQKSKKANAASYTMSAPAHAPQKSIEKVFAGIEISIDHFFREDRTGRGAFQGDDFKRLEREIQSGLDMAAHDPAHHVYYGAKDHIAQAFRASINRRCHNLNDTQKEKLGNTMSDWVWAKGIRSN